jgi:hypothetical protein
MLTFYDWERSMRGHGIGFLIGLLALLVHPVCGSAQIVIPDINKDTIIKIPSPGGEPSGREQSVRPPGGGDQTQRPTSGQQVAPDARCSQLPPALRKVTPGCRP